MNHWIRKPMASLALCVLLTLPVSSMAAPVAGAAYTGQNDQAFSVARSAGHRRANAGQQVAAQPARSLMLADNRQPSLWDQTKHNAAKAWHKTKHGAKRAWEGAKDLSSDAYHNAKKTVSKGVDTVEKKTDGKKNK